MTTHGAKRGMMGGRDFGTTTAEVLADAVLAAIQIRPSVVSNILESAHGRSSMDAHTSFSSTFARASLAVPQMFCRYKTDERVTVGLGLR